MASDEGNSGFKNWLTRIFKDGGGSCPRGLTGAGQHQQFREDENSRWRLPARPMDYRRRTESDQEEPDHVNSMNIPSSGLSNNRGRLQDQDEYLERALRDTGNTPSYPPYRSSPYYSTDYRICDGCNREIGYGNYLECMGTYFHPDCFRCHACGYPIGEQEFSLSGRDPYHKTCFRELTYPKCDVCHQFIPANAAGMIQYKCHPFWSQKYCPSHEYDNTARCCSCKRLESRNTRYKTLGDGRRLCSECMESAIMDTGECQPLYHAIRYYFEGMNMKLDQDIPLLLVERQALNEAILGEKHGFHQMPETMGLCVFQEQTVTSIRARPRIGGQRPVGMRTQNLMVSHKCEVTAILVLCGLPRLLTGAILVHELMRCWFRLKGYRNLNPEVEEGLCQVMSYMWLESEVMPGRGSMTSSSMATFSCSSSSSSSSSYSRKGKNYEAEKKLGEFFMHQIANDPSPKYGGAFRAANAAVSKYGLRRTLDHIRYSGNLPL